jgi:hypothetical protein
VHVIHIPFCIKRQKNYAEYLLLNLSFSSSAQRYLVLTYSFLHNFRRLGGPQSQSGHGPEEKNSQPLLGLEPLIIQPIAQHYTTELTWLLKTTWKLHKVYI